MLTQWGYEIDSNEPIISVSKFHDLTQNKYAKRDDAEIGLNLAAVSEQIRNFCGWHIAPKLKCKATISAEGGREIHLPAQVVCDVESVIDDGEDVTAFCEWSIRGRIRLPEGYNFSNTLDGIEVEYSAGVKSALLERIVVQATSNLLVSPAGIREEHAGGIGVSYVSDGESIISQRAMDALTTFKFRRVK